MWFHCDGLGWGGWLGGVLNWVVALGGLAIVGTGAAWLVRQLRGSSVNVKSRTDPLEIAGRRLAAGEITIEDYEAIRERLA